MVETRKIRIPSVSYLEMKIVEMGKIVNPTQEDIILIAQYKKLLAQRRNNKSSKV